MALVGSGWISINDLSNEYGIVDNGTRWLSWYYRGAGLVPNVTRNLTVPTSGSIWLSNFYNTSAIIPGSYFPRTIGWSAFTWPAYSLLDIYAYGGGGGGGGANFAYIRSQQISYQMGNGDSGRYYQSTYYYTVQDVGGAGANGGDSIFQCNGFNVVATGGSGGSANYYSSAYYAGQAGYDAVPPVATSGYGSNGDINNIGSGAAGGVGSRYTLNSNGFTFASRGGSGGAGGYAKKTIVNGGNGSHPPGTITSLHCGPGGLGGATGNNASYGRGNSGLNGWIDIYWS